MKKYKITYCIFLLFIIFSCTQKEKDSSTFYKEYIPQVSSDNGLIESKTLLTVEHQKNMIHVLESYHEKWKIVEGKLFVSKNIENELLWNYTMKANDSIWMREHIKDK